MSHISVIQVVSPFVGGYMAKKSEHNAASKGSEAGKDNAISSDESKSSESKDQQSSPVGLVSVSRKKGIDDDGPMHSGDFSKKAEDEGNEDSDHNGIAGTRADKQHASHKNIADFRNRDLGDQDGDGKSNTPADRVGACVEEFGAKKTWEDQVKIIGNSDMSLEGKMHRLKEVKGEIGAELEREGKRPSILA